MFGRSKKPRYGPGQPGREGHAECERCRAADGIEDRWITENGDRVPCPRCRPAAYAQWHNRSLDDESGQDLPPQRSAADFENLAERIRRIGELTPERWVQRKP